MRPGKGISLISYYKKGIENMFQKTYKGADNIQPVVCVTRFHLGEISDLSHVVTRYSELVWPPLLVQSIICKYHR